MGECVKNSISFTFHHGKKEKNEDENCEYEMIWSADGPMHLVKKVLTQPVVHTNDRVPLERGNAVIRATTKTSVKQQTELRLNMGTNADSDVDPKKLPARATKSKAEIVKQRLVRTFQMLVLIAAVNILLYMMLFKDWIDK
ncbi:Detected protein of confused Function [Hibiscus syriacus]|uniref:Detected protein of confused Function n=1 Tax=Hibiscus syriacus TaxID=106335 RepID=A0A6A2XSG4_HIBSY|nr:Detected protein of confused Function [Hibiscus syriacus]